MKKLWKILVPVLALAVIFTCVLAFASSAADTTVTIPDGTVEEGSGTNVVAIIRGGAEVAQYDTLKAAKDAAQTGDTIKVLTDFLMNASSVNMGLPAKTVTVDLNGKTLYADAKLTGRWNNTFIPAAGAKWTFTSSATDADGNTVRGKFVYTDTSVSPVFSMNNCDNTSEVTVENVDFVMRGTGSVFNATRGGSLTVKNSSISLTGSNAYPISVDFNNPADVVIVLDNVDISSKTPGININKTTNSVTATLNNVHFNTQGRFINVQSTETSCKTSLTLTDCTLVTSGDCGFAIKGGKLAITGTKTRVNMTAAKNFIWDTTNNSDVTLGYGIRFAENSFKSGSSAQLTAAQSQIQKDGLYGDTYPYVYGATKLWYENDGNKALTNWGSASTTAGNAQQNNSNVYAQISDFVGGATQGTLFSGGATNFPIDAAHKYFVVEMDFAARNELSKDGFGEIILNPNKTGGTGFMQDNTKLLRIARSSDGGVRFYFNGGSKAEKVVPLRQWAHISIVYRLYAADGQKTAVSVFIDGEHLATIENIYSSEPEFISDVRYKFTNVTAGAACFDNIRIASYANGDFENTVFAATPVADSVLLGNTKMEDLPGAQIVDGGYYRTLALAVKAAKPNDIITLLENSDEGVMVDKPLSIDDAGHVLANVTTHRLISYENLGPLHTFTVTGVKMNLTLYSDFVANLYIPAPDGYERETVTIGGKAYYVVKTDFAANKVGESKTVEVEGMNISVSILSYAKALFGLSTGFMENEKTLMADALVYANAAAKLINGSEYANITALLKANEGYKSTLKTFNGVAKDMTSVSAGFEYATLDLTAQPSFIFAIKSGAKVSVSYTNFWGVKVTKTEADAVGGKIVIDDMRIFDFANEFTLTVGEKRTTYSLADYAANTDVKDLCDALHTYIETAKAFKKANPAPVM